MITFREKIDAFLLLGYIGVTGVSSKKNNPANLIFNKFRTADYRVVPINPNAKEVEGITCYASLRDTPETVEGVVIASPPDSAEAIIRDCIDKGIRHVWFHSSVDNGSLDANAVKLAEDHGIDVIASGCPMMYVPPVDFGHKCIKWILNFTGKVPRK